MKKLVVLSSLAILSIATAASADTFNRGSNREIGNWIGVSGVVKASKKTAAAGPAQELASILANGGAQKVGGFESSTYNGRRVVASVSFVAGNVFYGVTFQIGAKSNGEINDGGAPYAIIKGEAAEELMDYMSKAGYAVNGGIGASRTQSKYVSCTSPVILKRSVTCVISTK